MNDSSGILHLLNFKNPVFASYIFWSCILLLKTLLMSVFTTYYRRKNKVNTSLAIHTDFALFICFTKILTSFAGSYQPRRCWVHEKIRRERTQSESLGHRCWTSSKVPIHFSASNPMTLLMQIHSLFFPAHTWMIWRMWFHLCSLHSSTCSRIHRRNGPADCSKWPLYLASSTPLFTQLLSCRNRPEEYHGRLNI